MLAPCGYLKFRAVAFIYPRFPGFAKVWYHLAAVLALVFQARMLWLYNFFRGPRGLLVLVDDWNFMMNQTGKGSESPFAASLLIL